MYLYIITYRYYLRYLMKLNKNSLPITIITISVLVVTLMTSPISNTTGQEVPSSVIQTGDLFTYGMNQNSSWDEFEMFEINNLTDLFYYEEEAYSSIELGIGDLELFFGRDVDPSASRDTTFTVEVDLTAQPGSISSGYFNSGEWNHQLNQFEWRDNDTFPIFDQSGQIWEYEGQDSFRSNQTYSMIPSEMEDSEIDVPEDVLRDTPLDEGGPGGPLSLDQGGPPPTTVPLLDRGTYTWTDDYIINGNSYNNVNLITAWSNFSGSFTGDYDDYYEVMGDEIFVNGTYELEYGRYDEYTFDSLTTLLVDIYTWEWSRFTLDYENDDFVIWEGNGFPGINVSGIGYEETFWELEQSMRLEEALSHYGNTRPTSSGTNVLETGDQLTFDMEGYSDGSDLMDIWYYDSGEYRSSEMTVDSTGDLVIDVYRHQNGSFEAITLFNFHNVFTYQGDYGYLDQGQWMWDNQTLPITFWYDEFEFEGFDAGSNTSYEIEPFLDEEMWIGDDDDQGGGGDGFQLNYPRNVPMINSTTEIIYENYTINGRDYFVEAEVITGNYEMSWQGPGNICFGPCGGLEVPVDIDVYAFGVNEFVYDSWTGALLGVYNEMEYEILVYGEIQVKDESGIPIYDGDGNPYYAGIDMENYGYEDFDISIVTHPNLYQSVQSVFPTPPVTTTPTSNTTTTSSTPQESEDTSSEGPALPVPILPLAIGLMVISVIYHKKKK